jgi:DNA-binding NtrC family response regulator
MAKILVVDDEDSIRDLLRKSLEKRGYSVSTASNGDEALAVLLQEEIDLLITDLVMPDKEGLEVIREVRKQLPNVKVIAISGGGRVGPVPYLTAAKHLGALRTFSKPISIQEIVSAIDDILDKN